MKKNHHKWQICSASYSTFDFQNTGDLGDSTGVLLSPCSHKGTSTQTSPIWSEVCMQESVTLQLGKISMPLYVRKSELKLKTWLLYKYLTKRMRKEKKKECCRTESLQQKQTLKHLCCVLLYTACALHDHFCTVPQPPSEPRQQNVPSLLWSLAAVSVQILCRAG